MSRRVLQAVLLGLVAWMAGCGSSDRLSGDLSAFASDLDPAAQSLTLVLMGSQRLSDRLYELRLFSPAMEAEMPVRVLLPQRYDASKARGYPVFYLLHGCCSEGRGYASWTDDGDLEAFTANMDAIFVMPEGGNGGLYADWYNGGAGGPPRWETFHIRELLPWIEQNYRVRRDRTGRALLGISMGGHGAFAYAARYPHYFGSAASLSGSLDSNTFLGSRLLDVGALLDGGEQDDIWGPRLTEEVRWRGHNPFDLAENLAGIALFIRSGNGRTEGSPLLLDIAEAAVHEMAVNVHDELERLDIPHRFDDYGFGTHTPEFWSEGVHLLIPQQLVLAQIAPTPVRQFSYRSIEPTFSVFGWTVSAQRDVVEFLRLGDASEAGFTLSGSGLVMIATAPWFARSAAHQALIDGRSVAVQSDTEGRLHFSIDLGPSRSIQEFRFGSPPGYLRTVRVEIMRR